MSTETLRPTSINCTQCGAGLNVLGGGRVRVHVCGYCGAELDAQGNYEVLATFGQMPRPESPFRIGMTGSIWGVDFTIIGTIGMIERHNQRVWKWVEHQLFSPTHGYAWLTWEEGHVVFSRKVRETPNPPRISAATIERSENRPYAWLRGERFSYYGSGTAEIDFVEGEFNWTPHRGSRTFYVSLLSDAHMLDIHQKENEIEYEVSDLVAREEAFEAFGVTETFPGSRRTHPLEVFERSSLGFFVRNTALVFAVLCVVLALGLSSTSSRLLRTGPVAIDPPLETEFDVTSPDRLVEIEIWSNVSNSWAVFSAELTHENGEEVAAFERGVEYYSGVQGGEHWSEGSPSASTRLHLPAGRYRLKVAQEEAEVDWAGGRLPTQVAVRVWQDVSQTLWLWGLAVLFALLGAIFFGQRFLHQHQRWAGSDWVDED